MGTLRFAHPARILALLLLAATAHAEPRSGIGINLDQPAYWQSDWPYIDELKRAGGWFTRCDPWSMPQCRDFANGASANDTKEQDKLELDADGWAKRLPAADDNRVKFRHLAALLFQGNGGANPAGRYVVLHDGDGTIAYRGAKKIEAQSKPGRDVLEVAKGEPVTLVVTRIDPANHLRNIRVVGPGGVCADAPPAWVEDASKCRAASAFRSLEQLSAAQTFHPAYVADLRGLRVLRFMKWSGANTSKLVRWDDRPKPGDALWNRDDGVPYEAMFELAALTGTDPWINMPVSVDDDFARRFAQLAKRALKPGSVLWFEYGNEPWNTAPPYGQAGVLFEEKARARWPGAGAAPWQLRLNWYALRSVQLCRVVKKEFGADAARVHCVAGSQAANAAVSETILGCELAKKELGDRCSRDFDALAIAPYFGYRIGDNAWTADPDGGLDKVFREIDAGLEQTKGWVVASKKVADQHGLPLIAYEGGQHLFTGRGGKTEAMLHAANRDPRMGAAITRLVDDWKAAGGQLFVAFSYTQQPGGGGFWGMKEHQRDDAAPKWRAIKALRDQACWWRGCAR